MSDIESKLRLDLAAAHRMAVFDGLTEGTWTHLSVLLPGDPEVMLVTPADRHWRQVTASSLVLIDASGTAVDGRFYDDSTYYIHYPIHKARADARCVLHLHPPYATALSMVKGGRLLFAEQNAATLYGRIGYVEDYDGFVTDLKAGEHFAEHLGENRVLILQSHGVIVVGATIAEAYTDLYLLERACKFQSHALTMGQELNVMAPAVAEATEKAATAHSYKQTHFAAMQRLLNADQPDYRD